MSKKFQGFLPLFYKQEHGNYLWSGYTAYSESTGLPVSI